MMTVRIQVFSLLYENTTCNWLYGEMEKDVELYDNTITKGDLLSFVFGNYGTIGSHRLGVSNNI